MIAGDLTRRILTNRPSILIYPPKGKIISPQATADLIIKEASHLAGVASRRKTKLWMRKTVAAHVPMHAAPYAGAMQSLDGIKMEKKTKRLVWTFLRIRSQPSLAVWSCRRF